MSTLFFLLLMVLPEFFTRVLLSVPSSEGVRMDPKQWLLCKLSPADILGGPGKEPREVRKLIEENKAVAMDVPERGQVLSKAIQRMVSTVEKNPTKQKSLLDLIWKEDWEDFTGPLAKRTLKYLNKK